MWKNLAILWFNCLKIIIFTSHWVRWNQETLQRRLPKYQSIASLHYHNLNQLRQELFVTKMALAIRLLLWYLRNYLPPLPKMMIQLTISHFLQTKMRNLSQEQFFSILGSNLWTWKDFVQDLQFLTKGLQAVHEHLVSHEETIKAFDLKICSKKVRQFPSFYTFQSIH